MASSTLFQELVVVEPRAAEVLGAFEVRRLRAGSSHRADSLREASFLIVEEGFVVIRRALTKQRGVIICAPPRSPTGARQAEYFGSL